MFFVKLQRYTKPLTRLSISFLFLWFGLNQIFDPQNFIGYLPEFILQLNNPFLFVMGNGIFETLVAVLLLVGIGVRSVSFVLIIHLLSIIITLGYNDIAVRDFTLMLITMIVMIGGKDQWCLNFKK